jgi:hypothetical protein
MKNGNSARQERGESPVLNHEVTPLTPEDRRKARDAFNALLDAADDDKHAIVTALTVQGLLLHRKKAHEETKITASTELNRLLRNHNREAGK